MSVTAKMLCRLLYAFRFGGWGLGSQGKSNHFNGKGGLQTPLFGANQSYVDPLGNLFGWKVKSLGSMTEDGPIHLAVSAPYMYYYNNSYPAYSGQTEGAVIFMELNETGHVVSDYAYNYPVFDDVGYDSTLLFGLGMEVIPDIDGDERPELLVADVDEAFSGPGIVRWVHLDAEGVAYNATTFFTAGERGAPNFYAIGASWTTLGDVNGDGIEDMAFGDPDSNTVYIVFFGEENTYFSNTPPHNPTGSNSSIEFGTCSSGLGDIDGDSVPDMAVRIGGEDDGLGTVIILMLTAAGEIKAWQELYLSDFVSEEEYLQQKRNNDTSFGHHIV
ncbi:FG-GAP repeat protein [Balamuthia mandrillaris]